MTVDDLTLRIGASSAAVRLWPSTAPQAAAWLASQAPFLGAAYADRWSGDAWAIDLADAVPALPEGYELPAVTLYPGTIGLWLGDASRGRPPRLVIALGRAEHRLPEGPTVITPLGEITGGLDALRGEAMATPLASAVEFAFTKGSEA